MNEPIMLSKKEIMEQRARSKALEPVVRIGKNGITDNVISEMDTLLRKRRLIKIKVLKNSLENIGLDDIIKEAVMRCKCTLVDRIGLTFSLYR